MQRFRLEVGHKHEVKPGNIVGAIANEAGLDSKHIGRIVIHDDYSLIDLPSGMPKDIFTTLKKTWVSGTQLNITELGSRSTPNEYKGSSDRKPKSGKTKSRSKPKSKPKTKLGNKNKKHKKNKKKLTLS
jgi:ATP-dependent RNA helicase DeaD